jgi:hypothetical protein
VDSGLGGRALGFVSPRRLNTRFSTPGRKPGLSLHSREVERTFSKKNRGGADGLKTTAHGLQKENKQYQGGCVVGPRSVHRPQSRTLQPPRLASPPRRSPTPTRRRRDDKTTRKSPSPPSSSLARSPIRGFVPARRVDWSLPGRGIRV